MKEAVIAEVIVGVVDGHRERDTAPELDEISIDITAMIISTVMPIGASSWDAGIGR